MADKKEVEKIFHILRDKLHKKEITNTDKKEVKRAFTTLASKLQNGYQLNQNETQIIRRSYASYKEDVTEAIAALSREQQLAFAEALANASQQNVSSAENENVNPETNDETTILETKQAESNEENTIASNDEEQTILEVENENEENTSSSNDEEQVILEYEDEDDEMKELKEKRKEALESIFTEQVKNPWTYSKGSISPTAIEAAMKSDSPSDALINVDDLIAANAYYKTKDDEEKSYTVSSIVINRLINLKPEDITPSNASSYYALCMQCNNEYLKKYALNIIADAMIKYDEENFGAFRPNEEALAQNYDKIQKDLKDIDPFALKYNAAIDGIDISNIEFTDAAGKPLSEKESKKQEKAISALAKEMAAQRLSKKGDYTPEELNTAIKEATVEIIAGSSPRYGIGGKPQVNVDTLASTIANQYLKTETFKDRCKQKFQNNPFVKKITNNVEKIDKELEDRYGKKYIYAKQALKFVGKISGSVAKTAAIYGVAGLVPGGTAVVIGYNIAKNWKNVKKQLKDPNASIAKKCAIIAGAAATTTLSGLGIASSIGTAMEAVNMVSPGMLNSATSFMGQLGTYGRLGVSTVATTLPNLVDSAKFKLQSAMLNRKIKKTTDATKLAELIEQQKALEVKMQNNNKELLLKGSSVVAGMGASQLLMPYISSFVQEEANSAINTVKTAATEHGINPWQDENSDLSNLASQPETTQTETQVSYRESVEPDEINGVKAHEENLEAAKAENSSKIEGKSSFAHTLQHLESLEDSRFSDTNAVAEGLSEHIGKDANLATIACKMAPHALQDVLRIDGLPDNNPTTHNMIQYLSTHDLSAEQQTALNNFIEQNFEGAHFKAENFADYTSTYHAVSTEQNAPASSHQTSAEQDASQTAQNVNHSPVQEQTNTSSERTLKVTTVYNDADSGFRHKNMPPSGNKLTDLLNDNYATTNDKGSGFHFEPIQQDPKPQPEVPQQPVQQTEVIYHEQNQQTDIYTQYDPFLDAERRGLIYDPILSNGINNIGDGGVSHSGYAGAFIDPRDGSVIILANDPLHDKSYTFANVASAREAQSHNTGVYDHSNHRDLVYDPCKKVTHCYGTGVITTNNDALNKVLTGVSVAINAVHTGLDIAERVRDLKGRF